MLKIHIHRGFTLVELLVAALIASFILGSAYYLLSGALKSVVKGTDKLEAMRTCRNALEHVRRDVQEAVGNIIVEETGFEENYLLKINQFERNDKGYPKLDPGSDTGFAVLTVEYLYDEVNIIRTVKTADGLESKRVVGKKIDDLNFSIQEIDIATTGNKIPAVMVEVMKEIDVEDSEKEIWFRTVAVPRYMAKWAVQPNWVINSIANKINYSIEIGP